MAFRKPTRSKILIAAGTALVIAVLVLLALSEGNGEILRHLIAADLSVQELQDLLESFGWRGYTVTIILSTLQVICAFLPAEPVQVLAGFSFGFPAALICCMMGVALGSTLIYLLQKTFGDRLRSFFIRKLNLDLEAIAHSSRATLIVILLYLLPAIPYGMICFFAASMGMRYRKYIVIMCLGALPSVCIGVGLGHITIASNWIITLCMFAALFLLLIVLFWKKDVLFTRLNNYASANRKMPVTRVRDVNVFVLRIVYALIRCWFFLCGVRLKTDNKVGQPETPSIVLCNHGSAIDFVCAAALLGKYKPNLIGARLYFYHRTLGWLLRTLGAFPKSMFAVDMENARNCFTVLRQKNHLVMMPEARLSTAGRFEDIQENTYSFLKSAGVTIYPLKINGSYLAFPKWGRGFRRGATVEAELDLLYTAEQVRTLSPEQIRQGVNERLAYDDLRWLQQRPHLRYRSRHIAEGLENILTTCPSCSRKHTLTTKKASVFCEHCGYLTSVTDRYAFTGDFRFADLTGWYDWQKALLEKEIAGNPDYTLSSKVELRLPGSGNSFTRHGGSGVCTLNRSGLTYAGSKDGKTVELHFPLRQIYRLLFGAGQNFEIYDGAEILFFVPEDTRTAVEWYMASMILHDEEAKAAA